MGKTFWVFAAAVASIVLLTCADGVLAQAKSDKTTIMPVGPKSPSGWYAANELDNALQTAEILGRPLAMMYQDNSSQCSLHNRQRDAWLKARELSGFVRVVVDSNEVSRGELFNKLRIAAGDRAGRYVPQLFLGSASGEFLGVVPYKTPAPKFVATVAGAHKTFGNVLPPKTAIVCWTKLKLARTHWSNRKIDAALKCYRDIKRHERTNPKLAIFVELRKDEEQINQKGGEEVAAAKALYENGEQGYARTAINDICRRYASFKPAKDARALRSIVVGGRSASKKRVQAQEESPIRMWTDVSGKFKVEAALVSIKDGSVILKNASGKTFSVPIQRLSRNDQEYVQENQEQADNK